MSQQFAIYSGCFRDWCADASFPHHQFEPRRTYQKCYITAAAPIATGKCCYFESQVPPTDRSSKRKGTLPCQHILLGQRLQKKYNFHFFSFYLSCYFYCPLVIPEMLSNYIINTLSAKCINFSL